MNVIATYKRSSSTSLLVFVAFSFMKHDVQDQQMRVGYGRRYVATGGCFSGNHRSRWTDRNTRFVQIGTCKGAVNLAGYDLYECAFVIFLFSSFLFFSFSLACPVRACRSQFSQCMAVATSSYHCYLQDLQEGFRGDGRGGRKIIPKPSK